MERSFSRKSSAKECIKKKLAGISGETIAETLVALLIAALALTMLAGAMSSSLKMVTKSRNKLNDYNTKTESMTGMSTAADGTIKIESDSDVSGLSLPEYQVKYGYNNEFSRTPVAVYKYQDPDAAAGG
ncbi:MAG: hypothetical protein IJ123_03470 [Blautia sp.]|nr:hypothetical protein [Blautia sp.]